MKRYIVLHIAEPQVVTGYAMQSSASMAAIWITEAGPEPQTPASSYSLGETQATPSPLKCQAARKSKRRRRFWRYGKCDVGDPASEGRSHCTLVHSGANRWPA